MIHDAFGRPHADGCRCIRINHRLEQCGGCRRSPLLEPRDALTECLPASLAVSRLKLRELQPAEECSGPNSSSAGRLLNVALGEQRSDGVLLFASENSAASCHQMPNPANFGRGYLSLPDFRLS